MAEGDQGTPPLDPTTLPTSHCRHAFYYLPPLRGLLLTGGSEC